MARSKAKTWREVRSQRSLNQRRMDYYGRVMEAVDRLEELRVQRGISEADYEGAQLIDPATGEEDTEDLARLARSVAALGGRLEVRAVFPEETVSLLLEPEPTDA